MHSSFSDSARSPPIVRGMDIHSGLVVLDRARAADLIASLDEHDQSAVAAATGLSTAQLAAMTSGPFEPSDQVVHALAALYGVPVEGLGPRRTRLRLEPAALVGPTGDRIELTTPQTVLGQYVALVASMRTGVALSKISWRDDDVEVLARAFDWSSAAVLSSLRALAAESPSPRDTQLWGRHRLLPMIAGLALGVLSAGTVLLVADAARAGDSTRLSATTAEFGVDEALLVERTPGGVITRIGPVGLLEPLTVERAEPGSDATRRARVEVEMIDPLVVNNSEHPAAQTALRSPAAATTSALEILGVAGLDGVDRSAPEAVSSVQQLEELDGA